MLNVSAKKTNKDPLMGNEHEIQKLIEIKNEAQTMALLLKIIDIHLRAETAVAPQSEEQTVMVTIRPGKEYKKLMWEGKTLFKFDVCRKGNDQYNVVSIIRDLLKQHYPGIGWTRKKVEPYIQFVN